jgi:hypothetical protein
MPCRLTGTTANEPPPWRGRAQVIAESLLLVPRRARCRCTIGIA